MWKVLTFLLAALAHTTAHNITIQEVLQKDDKSVWLSRGRFTFYSEEGHLITRLPIQECTAAVKATMALTSLLAIITGDTEAQAWPRAVELNRLLSQVETATAQGPYDVQVNNNVHAALLSTQPQASRNKREIKEYFIHMAKSAADDLISVSNNHIAVTVPPEDLFADYSLFNNTAAFVQIAYNYSVEVNHNTTKMERKVVSYLREITYSGFFERSFDFLHGILALLQRKLTPTFFNQENAKRALAQLSQEVSKEVGKSLASSNIQSAVRFPFSFLAKNHELHLILSIPIVKEQPIQAHQLTKKEYFFQRDNQAYKFTFETHYDILATNSDNTAVLMQNSDLDKCFLSNDIHFCPTQPRAGNLHSTCLASIYSFNAQAILQNCQISLTKITTSDLITLYDNTYQVTAQTPQSMSYTCDKKPMHKTLAPGIIYEITLDQFCNRIQASSFAVGTDITGPPETHTTRPFLTEALTALAFGKLPFQLHGSFIHSLTRNIQAIRSHDPWTLDADEVTTILASTATGTLLLSIVMLTKFCVKRFSKMQSNSPRAFWKRSRTSDAPPYMP